MFNDNYLQVIVIYQIIEMRRIKTFVCIIQGYKNEFCLSSIVDLPIFVAPPPPIANQPTNVSTAYINILLEFPICRRNMCGSP